MAFDATEPADNTKIRNLGLVLRSNFSAMETGDTSYNPIAVNLATTSDPSATSNMYRLYSKDVSSVAELHGIDENGNVIRFTTGGDIGSTGENLRTKGISFDNSFFYNRDALCTAWAASTNGTSKAYGYQISTITKNGAHLYTATFSSALSDANYAVVLTKFDSGSFGMDSRIPVIRSKSVSSFTYEFRTEQADPNAVGHFFQVFGGR